jgi:hypothetical protein
MSSVGMVELGVDFDGLKNYAIEPGTRHMREAPAFVERFSTGEPSHKGDSFWQHFTMSGFRGGIGQDVFSDVERVRDMYGLDGSTTGRLVPWYGWTQKLDHAYVNPGSPSTPSYKYRSRRFATSTDSADISTTDHAHIMWMADEYGIHTDSPSSPDVEHARVHWVNTKDGDYLGSVVVDGLNINESVGHSLHGIAAIGAFTTTHTGLLTAVDVYCDDLGGVHLSLEIGSADLSVRYGFIENQTVSTSGWQTFTLPSPVACVAGQTFGYRCLRVAGGSSSTIVEQTLQSSGCWVDSTDLGYPPGHGYQTQTFTVPYACEITELSLYCKSDASYSDLSLVCYQNEQAPWLVEHIDGLSVSSNTGEWVTGVLSTPYSAYAGQELQFHIYRDGVNPFHIAYSDDPDSYSGGEWDKGTGDLMFRVKAAAPIPIDAHGDAFLRFHESETNMSSRVLDSTADIQGVSSLTYFQPKKTVVTGTTQLAGYMCFGGKNGTLYICDLGVAHADDATIVGPAEPTAWTTATNTPLTAGIPIDAMCVWGNKLYVSQNNKVWGWTAATNLSTAGDWTTTPVLEADVHFTCATTWNGKMYWGGYQSYTGKIYSVDAAVGIEAAKFSDNFTVQSLCPYGGMLYVGGAMYDENRGRHVGRVYKFNGSSLSELDLGQGGIQRQADYLHGIWDMEVWEGKLLIPAADYAGLIAYDAAEDAFYRLPAVAPFEVGSDEDYQMANSIAVFRGIPWVAIPKFGLYEYDVGVLSRSVAGGTYYFDTSMFDAGLALVDKLFWEISCDVHDRKAGDAIVVSYRTSFDGDWTELGYFSSTVSVLSFPHGLLARAMQLRFDFRYASGSAMVFRGFHCRYTIEPEVRRSWSMSLACCDNVEIPCPVGGVGLMETRTGKQMRDDLWALRETRKPVMFRDVDGVQYLVAISSISEYQKSVNQDDGMEVSMAVVLWEAGDQDLSPQEALVVPDDMVPVEEQQL